MNSSVRSSLNKPWAFAAIMIILGAVLVLFPGMTLVYIVRLGGAALILGGIGSVVSWCRMGRHQAGSSYLDIAGGIFAVLGGLFLMLRPQVLIDMFPTVAGVLIILNGFFNLLKALDSRRLGFSKWLVSLLLAAVTIALGIFLLAHPFSTMQLLVRILGVVLIYNGLSSLWIVTR